MGRVSGFEYVRVFNGHVKPRVDCEELKLQRVIFTINDGTAAECK